MPQDPSAALNPALRIGMQLEETLVAHRFGANETERRQRLTEMLEEVLLPSDRGFLRRYPHQLSGGQQQRVGLAMAFACRPRVIVLDEPTTGLDVTTQAHVLQTVRMLCRTHGVAALYVSHDLAVVAALADRVAVMYAGRVVERAPTHALFKQMHMPYTEALLAAIPKLETAPHTPLPAISGRPPDPTRPIKGCSFSPRCRYAVARCHGEKPELTAAETPAHQFACFHPIEMPATVPA